MIGARTHLLDCWDPQLEWIRVPRILFQPQEFYASLIRYSVSRNIASRSFLRKYRMKTPLEISGLYHDIRMLGPENIAHAMIGGVVGVLACQSAAKTLGIDAPITAILPANTAVYVKELYQLLGIPVLTTDRPLIGDRFESNFNPRAFFGLAKQLLPRMLIEKLEADSGRLPKRIYLARRGSRSVRNANEIESLLVAKGFTKIYPEQLSVLEQIRLLWHADAVIGVHGAAIAALLFRALKTDSHPFYLMELFGPGYIVTLYRHLVAEIGGDWIGIRGRVTPQVIEDLDTKQGRGPWRRVSNTLSGYLPQRILGKGAIWQRDHQASSFDVDPASIEAALDVLKSKASEPSPRLIHDNSAL